MTAELTPLPTSAGQKRLYGEFPTFTAALDYAATGSAGYNIYDGRGQLKEALSYHRLRQEALSAAIKLLDCGLRPGDRVAIVAESDGDFARVFFGCQYAGLVPAPFPLPVAFGGREAYRLTLTGMMKSAGVRALFMPDVIQSWAAEITEGFDLCYAGTLSDFLKRSTAAQIPLTSVTPNDLSYLQFSSGSTRFPMGVAVTQAAGMANVHAIARYGLQVREEGDRCVSWLPLYHDMGLVGFFLTPMTCQLTVDLLPTREFARRPHVWLELIARNRATITYSPSFGYELCARRAPPAAIDLSSWRVAGIGGDMIRPQILEAFAERYAPFGFDSRAFVASYGLAEATLAISFAPLQTGIKADLIDLRRLETDAVALPADASTSATRNFVLCGSVLPGHELEVRDAQGHVLKEREIGQIFIRGPSLMQGYFNNAPETRSVLQEDGWLDTGDLGYMLNSQIVITGRVKDLIIINGRNIWPQDLEWSAETGIDALRSRDVAVFAVENADRENVVALVQCRSSDPDTRENLRQEVASLIRHQHGVEVDVILVPPHTLPQTSSGKLTRARARAMLLAGKFTLSEAPAA